MDKKEELIRNAKIRKPKGKDIGLNTSWPIIITGDLSREAGHILKKAKELRDNGYYEFAWERDGKILSKYHKDAQAIRVRSIPELMAIISEIDQEEENSEQKDEEMTEGIETQTSKKEVNGKVTENKRMEDRTKKNQSTRTSPVNLRKRSQNQSHQQTILKYASSSRSTSCQNSNSGNSSKK